MFNHDIERTCSHSFNYFETMLFVSYMAISLDGGEKWPSTELQSAMFIFTQNSYVEALIYNVLVFECRAFEK